jgi:methyl-accepting chemotaxis protein
MITKLAECLALAGIDEGTCAILRETWPLIRESVPYALQSAFASAAAPGAVDQTPGQPTRPQIDAARERQARHWEALFAAKFDEAYADSVRQTAVVHAQVGLDPRWLVSGHLTTLTELHSLVLATHAASMMSWAARSRLERVIRAVDQAVMFDLQLCIAAYTDHTAATMREAVKQVAMRVQGAAGALAPEAMAPQSPESRQAASDLFVGAQRRTFHDVPGQPTGPQAYAAPQHSVPAYGAGHLSTGGLRSTRMAMRAAETVAA